MRKTTDFKKIPLYLDGYREDFYDIFLCCRKSVLNKNLQKKVNTILGNQLCLNDINMDELFTLKMRGVSQIIATRSNCHTCEFSKELDFDDTLSKTNDTLEEKNINSFAIQWIDVISWQSMYQGKLDSIENSSDKLLQESEKPAMNRRDFFRTFAKK